jgi:hypothetical protein
VFRTGPCSHALIHMFLQQASECPLPPKTVDRGGRVSGQMFWVCHRCTDDSFSICCSDCTETPQKPQLMGPSADDCTSLTCSRLLSVLFCPSDQFGTVEPHEYPMNTHRLLVKVSSQSVPQGFRLSDVIYKEWERPPGTQVWRPSEHFQASNGRHSVN